MATKIVTRLERRVDELGENFNKGRYKKEPFKVEELNTEKKNTLEGISGD